MAQLFDPRYQAVDANGLPYSGAQLTFYQAGTTTKITIYQDSAGTTPHTNPVIADSTGTFAPIFLSVTSPYKFVLQTSGGTTITTLDNILPDLAGLTAAADQIPYFSGPSTLSVTDLGSMGIDLLATASAEEARAAIGYGSRQANYPTAGTYTINADDFSPGAIHRVYAAGTVQIDVSALTMNQSYDFVTWTGSTLVLDSSGASDYFVASGILFASLIQSITILPNHFCRLRKVAGGRIEVHYLPYIAAQTFTPGLAFGGASTGMTGTFSGIYTRIGNQMTMHVNIVLTAKGSSTGTATITGLPYAHSGVTTQAIAVGNCAAFTGLTGALQADVSGTTIRLFQSSSTGNTVIADTAFTNTSILRVGGTYLTAV